MNEKITTYTYWYGHEVIKVLERCGVFNNVNRLELVEKAIEHYADKNDPSTEVIYKVARMAIRHTDAPDIYDIHNYDDIAFVMRQLATCIHVDYTFMK